MPNLIDDLRSFIKRSDKTQEEISEAIGISPSTLSNFMNAAGKRNLSLEKAAKLCEFLDLQLVCWK